MIEQNAALADAIDKISEAVCSATAVMEAMPASYTPDHELHAAREKLTGILRQSEDQTTPAEVASETGELGTPLLLDLMQRDQTFGEGAHQPEIQRAIVGLAIWVVRQDGEIRLLEPLVNALAYLANHSNEEEELIELSQIMGEIVDAVPAEVREAGAREATDPWRVLNYNRGIIATRSHKAVLMEEAFESLIRNCPEDAKQFFAQGMEQMDIVGYPQSVRSVMHMYYQRFWEPARLH